MTGYVFIFLTIMFTVYGQLIIKYEISAVSSPPSGLALIGFLVKFVLFRPLVISGLLSAVLASFAWMAALSRFELSYAYPFMSLNFVVVVLLSFMLFDEQANGYKLIGLALICLGVLVVSKGAEADQVRQTTQSAPSFVAERHVTPDRDGGNTQADLRGKPAHDADFI